MSAGYGGKSASLRLVIDGKNKQFLINNNPFLKIKNETVPALNPSQSYKYLGVNISSLETKHYAKQILYTGLKELTEAPLKPQIRVFLLSTFLIPKLYHQLILRNTTISGLTTPSDHLQENGYVSQTIPLGPPSTRKLSMAAYKYRF